MAKSLLFNILQHVTGNLTPLVLPPVLMRACNKTWTAFYAQQPWHDLRVSGRQPEGSRSPPPLYSRNEIDSLLVAI
jgi:hypothetical protein